MTKGHESQDEESQKKVEEKEKEVEDVEGILLMKTPLRY